VAHRIRAHFLTNSCTADYISREWLIYLGLASVMHNEFAHESGLTSVFS
jgi:hypothetical protein